MRVGQVELWVGVPTSLSEKADTKTQNKCGTEYQFFHGDSVNHNIFLLIDRLLPAFDVNWEK